MAAAEPCQIPKAQNPFQNTFLALWSSSRTKLRVEILGALSRYSEICPFFDCYD